MASLLSLMLTLVSVQFILHVFTACTTVYFGKLFIIQINTFVYWWYIAVIVLLFVNNVNIHSLHYRTRVLTFYNILIMH